MILVAAESVELQVLKRLRAAIREFARCRDLVEEQRIGVIDDRQVQLSTRKGCLQLVVELGESPHVEMWFVEGQRQIEVASVVETSGHGRAKHERQSDPVAGRHLTQTMFQRRRDHGGEYNMRSQDAPAAPPLLLLSLVLVDLDDESARRVRRHDQRGGCLT